MKSIFILTLILFFAFNLRSQDAEPIKKWRFGVELLPNLTNFITKTDYDNFRDDLKNIQSNSIPKFSFSGRFFVSNTINEKSSISIGLGYQNIGNNYNGNSSTGTITYNHHNIQIPIFFSYKLTNKLFIKTGISPTINLLNTFRYELTGSILQSNESVKIPNEIFRGLNYSFNLGVGFVLFSSQSFELYAQANAETTLLRINPSSIYEQRPISLGLAIGAIF